MYNLNDLLDSTFELIINLNDTFYHASDAYKISSYNMELIVPVFEKYGRDALVGYIALARGHDPLSRFVTPNFLSSKKEISEITKIKLKWDNDD